MLCWQQHSIFASEYKKEGEKVGFCLVRGFGFVAELVIRHDVIVIFSAISPYRQIREEVRRTIGRFVEVYVNAPLAVCEHRDVKGLYKRARAGEIRNFTGIDDPYEPPLNPEVECRTDLETIEESAAKVLQKLGELGVISPMNKGWGGDRAGKTVYDKGV